MSNKSNITIQVGYNLEKALKKLKKQMEREGISRDIKRLVYFESPCQKRRKKQMRAEKMNYIRMLSQQPIK